MHSLRPPAYVETCDVTSQYTHSGLRVPSDHGGHGTVGGGWLAEVRHGTRRRCSAPVADAAHVAGQGDYEDNYNDDDDNYDKDHGVMS